MGHKFIAKAIGSDDHARLKAHAVLEDAFRGEDDPGHQPAIVADAGAAAHKDLRLQMRTLPDDRTVLDDAKRADRGGGRHLRARRDLSRPMNARRRLGPEHLLNAGANARQRRRGIVDQQEELIGLRLPIVVQREQHGRGAGGGDFAPVFGIPQEGQLAGAGGGEGADAAHRLGGRAARLLGLRNGQEIRGGEGNLHGPSVGIFRGWCNASKQTPVPDRNGGELKPKLCRALRAS